MRPLARLRATMPPVLWTVAGGTLGMAVSLTRSLAGHAPEPWAPAMAAFGGVTGALALQWARRHPVDQRVWLQLVPAGVATPAVLWLGVLGTIRTTSVVPAALSAWLATLIGFGVWRTALWSRLAGAVRRGGAEGDAELEALAALRIAPRSVRARAAWVRGMRAWHEGDGELALHWLVPIRDPEVVPAAAATVGLIHALRGEEAPARAALARVYESSDAIARAQADGVRLLMVLRRDGADVARELGTRLYAPRSSALLVGVWAVARDATGDPAGADGLLTPRFCQALRDERLDQVVDEVGALLRRLGR